MRRIVLNIEKPKNIVHISCLDLDGTMGIVAYRAHSERDYWAVLVSIDGYSGFCYTENLFQVNFTDLKFCHKFKHECVTAAIETGKDVIIFENFSEFSSYIRT